MNMAITCIYLDEYQGADSMLNLSMSMLKDMPEDPAKMITIHHLWGLLYLKLRQQNKAFEALNQSKALALQLNNLPSLTASYITEGQVYEQTGDTLSAIKSYTRALGYANQYSGLSDQSGLSELLYKLYKKRGPTDSVSKYLDLFTDLKARSKADQAKEELMRTELMRDYTQMVENWERNQQPARKQKTYLLFALALSLLSGLVLFIRYRNQQRKIRFERVRRDLEERKSELEQRRLQAELNQQAAELDSLRSELSRQHLLEGLVSGLDPSKPMGYEQVTGQQELIKGSATERKAKAWEEFEYRFQQLHSGFYDRLNQQFPDLTINERRLCAFLMLDMTTKEISDITGQSVRAVNMARIRLRNKLGLTHTDKDLFAFLSSL
jgi:tetratricopeptide (TPR) repeat protein/DNA-binding CsgD family transcriptional regulator